MNTNTKLRRLVSSKLPSHALAKAEKRVQERNVRLRKRYAKQHHESHYLSTTTCLAICEVFATKGA